jgi:magnesium transporter
MGIIATHFGLHPVAADDAVQAHQRPKLDIIGDVTFLVLKSAVYVGNHADVGVGEVVETGEVMLLVGPDFVITVRHGQACELMDVRRQLEQTPLMLAHGPMSVLHAVVERVVGDYDSVADAITDDIDELEVRVFESVDGTDVQRVYQLKRELMEFSRAVRPLVRPLQILSSGKHPGVGDDLAAYLRDVEEEVNRVSERIAGDDELVVNLLGATLSQLALRQNDDMRKMSAWLAIGAVPTTIGAIYGMNFDHMPELHTQYGYVVCLGGMGVLMGWLFRTFKRSGWL